MNSLTDSGPDLNGYGLNWHNSNDLRILVTAARPCRRPPLPQPAAHATPSPVAPPLSSLEKTILLTITASTGPFLLLMLAGDVYFGSLPV